MRLRSAGNTQGPALYILECIKGYKVMVMLSDEEDSDWMEWIAVNDKNEFFAESAEALLGLVTIYEEVGEKWNQYSAYDREHIWERDPWDFI